MLLNIDKYLIDLRKNANRFLRININGIEDKSFSAKYTRKFIFILISLGFLYFIRNGFSQNFVSYTSTVLSILIGLFITAVIFSFDKFHDNNKNDNKVLEIEINKENLQQVKSYKLAIKDITPTNSNQNIWNKQSFNYTKQFAYITGYNIVLCIFIIVALSFSSLFEKTMSLNFFIYTFNFSNITIDSLKMFIKLSFTVLQRLLIMYLMLTVMYNTLFVVTSMVKFMIVKIDRKND